MVPADFLSDLATSGHNNVEMDDWDLLRKYVATGSEDAFAGLVRRYLDMVYSVAWRRLNDMSAAQEVAQSVFCLLASKARQLSPGTLLGPWLYHTACFKSAEYSRSEHRRQAREREAMNSMDTPQEVDTAWNQLAPLLDDAVQHLNEADRQAIVLRFFERKSLRDVGLALRLDDDAARKRVSRAVDKLRAWFAKKGISCSASVLSATLLAHAVQTAPAGIAGTLVKAALVTATLTASPLAPSFLSNLLTSMITKKVAAVAAITAALITPPALLWNQNRQLRGENAELRWAVAENSRLREENAALARGQFDADELARLKSAQTELARLRNLVNQLHESSNTQNRLSSSSVRNSPLAESTPTSHAFNSSVKARIPSGQTLAIGGWAHQPGKRLLSLVKPAVGAPPNETGQIHISTTLVEVPEEVWDQLGLDNQNHDPNTSNPFQSMLSNDQSQDFLNRLTNQAGVSILSHPRVTHSEGVPASIFIGDADQGPSQSIEFKSRLSADGQEVDIEMDLQIVSSQTPETASLKGENAPPN